MVKQTFLIKFKVKGLYIGLGIKMAGSVGVILKKIFSLALIFNALITIAGVAGIIFGITGLIHIGNPTRHTCLTATCFGLHLQQQ